MSDSDCVDSNSNYYIAKGTNKTQSSTLPPKCFWLMHQFADIATRNISTTNNTLLQAKYRLPIDYTAKEYQEPGAIKTVTVEELHKSRHMAEASSHFDRIIHLNSED